MSRGRPYEPPLVFGISLFFRLLSWKSIYIKSIHTLRIFMTVWISSICFCRTCIIICRASFWKESVSYMRNELDTICPTTSSFLITIGLLRVSDDRDRGFIHPCTSYELHICQAGYLFLLDYVSSGLLLNAPFSQARVLWITCECIIQWHCPDLIYHGPFSGTRAREKQKKDILSASSTISLAWKDSDSELSSLVMYEHSIYYIWCDIEWQLAVTPEKCRMVKKAHPHTQHFLHYISRKNPRWTDSHHK